MSHALQRDVNPTDPVITGIDIVIATLAVGVPAMVWSFGWPDRWNEFTSAVALRAHAKSLVLAGAVLIALGFYVRWLNRRIQRLERRLTHLETWAEDAG